MSQEPSPATRGESPDEWYEREKTAFRAWWESEGEKTFSRTPTLAAGAGWFARAEAAPETAPIVPCLAPNGCTTPEWCARNSDACRVKTPVSETPRNQMAVKGCEPIKSPANVLVYAEEAGKALAESLDKDEIEIRRAASAPSAAPRSMDEARAIGLLRVVRDEWYRHTPYSELKASIDGLLGPLSSAKNCRCTGGSWSEKCTWPKCVEGAKP